MCLPINNISRRCAAIKIAISKIQDQFVETGTSYTQLRKQQLDNRESNNYSIMQTLMASAVTSCSDTSRTDSESMSSSFI